MNITDPIGRNARLAPLAPAILHYGELLTYSQLNAVVDSIALRLITLGLAPGQAAGVMLTHGHAQLAFTLALARIGVTAVVSRDAVRGTGGLALSATFADGATGAEASGATVVDESWWRAPTAPVAARSRSVPSHPDGSATCLVVTSSGTTGVPKAIALSHDMLRARQYAKWLAFRAPDVPRQICSLGMESYYGFSTALRTLWMGGLAVTGIRWDDIPVAIPFHQLNSLVVSPTQLGRMLESFPPGSGPFPGLQVVEVGGSALPSRLAAAARAQLCGNVQVAYGAAELGFVASMGSGLLEGRPGAVGYVAPGVEVQAVGTEDQPLAASTEGLLRIRSATCVDAYVGDPAASARAFRRGWFYPGDVGAIADDGLISVAGRSGEMINAGGVKVSPRDIEDVVLRNPNVGEAAAFAMPNPATGLEEAWVAVVQKQAVDLQVLHRYCLNELGVRAPRSIMIVGSLPRNERGKLLVDELVRLARAAKKTAP